MRIRSIINYFETSLDIGIYIEIIPVGLFFMNVFVICANVIFKVKIKHWILAFSLPFLTIVLTIIACYAMPTASREGWYGGMLLVLGVLLACVVAIVSSLLSFVYSEKNKHYTLIVSIPALFVVLGSVPHIRFHGF